MDKIIEGETMQKNLISEEGIEPLRIYLNRSDAGSDVENRLRRTLRFTQEREENAQQVLRSEYKYLLSLGEARACERVLRTCIQGDPHNGANGYCVRSLYFDTLGSRDYQDKIDGVDARRKLRLRIYDTRDAFAFLEMKQKQGDRQRKRSLRILREDAQRMICCDYDVLLHYDTAFAEECHALLNLGGYRPKVVVQFQRSAYIGRENDTRITFDHTLRATQASFDLFSPQLGLYPVLDPWAVILEVKYNAFLLNHVKMMLQTVDRMPLAQSKYCLACAATL